MSLPGIIGPQSNGNTTVELKIPDCVKITNEKDIEEFRNFVAEVINRARLVWEQEKK